MEAVTTGQGAAEIQRASLQARRLVGCRACADSPRVKAPRVYEFSALIPRSSRFAAGSLRRRCFRTPRGRLGAWTRAAGTWAALSTGGTGKAHLPGLLLRGPPLQHDASAAVAGAAGWCRAAQGGSGRVTIVLSLWLAQHKARPLIRCRNIAMHLGGHHVLRCFMFRAGIPLL